MNIFDNEITWIAIGIATFCCLSLYFTHTKEMEKEKTKQLEITLRMAQLSPASVTTNSIAK